MTKVSNLANNGRAVANQLIIENWENNLIQSIVFQSYESTVCVLDVNNVSITFGRDWDYSKTTMKHLNHFLSGYPMSNRLTCSKDIRKAIKDGFIGNVKVIYDESLR